MCSLLRVFGWTLQNAFSLYVLKEFPSSAYCDDPYSIIFTNTYVISFGYVVKLFFKKCCIGHVNDYIEDFLHPCKEVVEKLTNFVGFCFLLSIFLLNKLLPVCQIWQNWLWHCCLKLTGMGRVRDYFISFWSSLDQKLLEA